MTRIQHTKEADQRRRLAAKERQAARDARSPLEQLALLEERNRATLAKSARETRRLQLETTQNDWVLSAPSDAQ